MRYLILMLVPVLLLAGCTGEQASRAERPSELSSTTPLIEQRDLMRGRKLFASTCGICHGPTGQGMKGLGKDLIVSPVVVRSSDAELLEFVKTGRPADHPLNETGVIMPPKGGRPELTDEELLDIIAYLRSLQRE